MSMRFEFVTTKITIFKNVTQCSLMDVYRPFGRAITFLRNGVTSQKIVIFSDSYSTLRKVQGTNSRSVRMRCERKRPVSSRYCQPEASRTYIATDKVAVK
jgi:hypothetical protein